MKRAEVTVTGMVQGVFFRVETRDRARSLGLAGWVTNAPDGTVRAAFEGDDERVRVDGRLVPAAARAARTSTTSRSTWAEPEGEQGFTIR